MKNFSRAVLFLILSTILFFGYMNCSSPRPEGSLVGLQIGNNAQSSSGAFLAFTTPDPIFITPSTFAFNASGICDDGGAFDNQIGWVLTDLNGGLIADSGTFSHNCTSGQFFLTVQTSGLPQGTSYVLQAEMVLRDDGGQVMATIPKTLNVSVQ